MRLKASWVVDLSEVVGQWGFDSQVAVRQKGSMDENLFMKTVLFYKSLYPNLSPHFKWEGNMLIQGAILIKSDSGPYCYSKSDTAVKF